MLLFQCDWTYPTPGSYAGNERCPEPAILAFEGDFGYGRELHYFCGRHKPPSWAIYDRIFKVEGDGLVELGVSKARHEAQEVVHNTIGRECPDLDTWTERPPRELVRAAVKRHWEKKQDVLAMHALGVKWEP